MTKEFEFKQITYIAIPSTENLCDSCAAFKDLELCDSLGTTCVNEKVIWVAGTSRDAMKDILRRVRPLVDGLTRITDTPDGEDLQLLKDIDKALEI